MNYILKTALAFLIAGTLAHAEIGKEIQYTRSVEYQAIATAVYRLATSSIEEALSKLDQDTTYAIVLDVDETVMDNSVYQEENKGVFDPIKWDEWTKRRAAGAVPGAREFLDRMRNNPRVRIVFITDRNSGQEADTVANMRALGLFTSRDLMLTKRDKNDTKKNRRDCVEKAVDERCKALGPAPILAQIGDSARDFVEFYGDDMKTEGRDRILKNAGKKYWIIPNALYGQWERDYK